MEASACGPERSCHVMMADDVMLMAVMVFSQVKGREARPWKFQRFFVFAYQFEVQSRK